MWESRSARRKTPARTRPVDQRATVLTAGDRVGGRGGQPVQDAGAQQERQGVRRLGREHRVPEVVRDVGLGIAGPAGPRAQRQREPDGPALGAREQGPHLVVRQRSAEQPRQLVRLRAGEREVVDGHVGQLAAEPQPGQRVRRAGPAAPHEAHRRRLAHQRRHRRDGGGIGQAVGVVEHQDRRRKPLGEGVRQVGEGVAVGRHHRRVSGGREGGEQVAPQPRRIVVALVHAQPGHALGRRRRLQPRREQRRLARPGRAR